EGGPLVAGERATGGDPGGVEPPAGRGDRPVPQLGLPCRGPSQRPSFCPRRKSVGRPPCCRITTSTPMLSSAATSGYELEVLSADAIMGQVPQHPERSNRNRVATATTSVTVKQLVFLFSELSGERRRSQFELSVQSLRSIGA